MGYQLLIALLAGHGCVEDHWHAQKGLEPAAAGLVAANGVALLMLLLRRRCRRRRRLLLLLRRRCRRRLLRCRRLPLPSNPCCLREDLASCS